MPTRTRQYRNETRGLKRQRTNAEARISRRKQGVRELKRGMHKQQWRQTSPASPLRPAKRLKGPGATLGPMGELGDDVIIELNIKQGYLNQLRQAGMRQATPTGIFKIVRQYLYVPLRQYLNIRINLHVPADTGDLRNSMKNALTPSGGSLTNRFPLLVLLNTKGIPYAGPVNQMPTRWLRHPSRYHKNIGRFGASLSDPKAIKGWYGLTLLQGRQQAAKLFQAMVKYIASLIPSNFAGSTMYNIARAIFTYKKR